MKRDGNLLILPDLKISDDSDAPKERTSEMETKKKIRARVRVGTDANGKAIYRWVGAYTRADLKLEKERVIREFVLKERAEQE